MEFKMTVGVSNKHVHLTKEVYETLFDEPLEIVKELHQIGEFASNQFVTLKSDANQLEHVRIVGPFRPYNQIEVCKSDAMILKINPPVRKSGDLKNSETITLIGPKGEITLQDACIIAERHIHMNFKDQEKYEVKDNDQVRVFIPGVRGGLVNTFVKVTENGYFEMHIDRDEANAFALKDDDEVTLIID